MCPYRSSRLIVRANSRRLRLRRVEEAAWGIAVRQLTAAFRGLDEETAGKLVEEDWLGVRKEEEAFEGLVYWIKGCALRGLWGRELLEKIRLGVMEEGYLEEKARGMVPEQHQEWMEGLCGGGFEGNGGSAGEGDGGDGAAWCEGADASAVS